MDIVAEILEEILPRTVLTAEYAPRELEFLFVADDVFVFHGVLSLFGMRFRAGGSWRRQAGGTSRRRRRRP